MGLVSSYMEVGTDVRQEWPPFSGLEKTSIGILFQPQISESPKCMNYQISFTGVRKKKKKKKKTFYNLKQSKSCPVHCCEVQHLSHCFSETNDPLELILYHVLSILCT